MLLHDGSGRERRLQAMRGAAPDHLPETAERVAARLGVVGHPVEEALHLRRRAQAPNQAPLGRREPVEVGLRQGFRRTLLGGLAKNHVNQERLFI